MARDERGQFARQGSWSHWTRMVKLYQRAKRASLYDGSLESWMKHVEQWKNGEPEKIERVILSLEKLGASPLTEKVKSLGKSLFKAGEHGIMIHPNGAGANAEGERLEKANANEDRKIKIPDGLFEAYDKAYRKAHRNNDPDEEPRWLKRAEGPKGQVWRAADGWGETYFLAEPVEKGGYGLPGWEITHLATRWADVMTYSFN